LKPPLFPEIFDPIIKYATPSPTTVLRRYVTSEDSPPTGRKYAVAAAVQKAKIRINHTIGPLIHAADTTPTEIAAMVVIYDGVSLETRSAAPTVTNTEGQCMGLLLRLNIAASTPSVANTQELSATTIAARTHLSCDRLTSFLQFI
jgi:hypothetical protein